MPCWCQARIQEVCRGGFIGVDGSCLWSGIVVALGQALPAQVAALGPACGAASAHATASGKAPLAQARLVVTGVSAGIVVEEKEPLFYVMNSPQMRVMMDPIVMPKRHVSYVSGAVF